MPAILRFFTLRLKGQCNLPSQEKKICAVDCVLHEAALGSMLRSLEDPITTNANNIDGFLNMLVAARDAEVRRFVYAASSSACGDHPDLPKGKTRLANHFPPMLLPGG